MTVETVTQNQIHVFYDGNSFDIDLRDLDVGVGSSDEQIRTAVAGHLDAPVEKLRRFTVHRHNETNNITLAPQAVFG